jgi:hypothetical protein
MKEFLADVRVERPAVRYVPSFIFSHARLIPSNSAWIWRDSVELNLARMFKPSLSFPKRIQNDVAFAQGCR